MRTEVIHLIAAWIQRAVPRPLRRGLKCRNSLTVEKVDFWKILKILRQKLKILVQLQLGDLPGGSAEYWPRKSSRRTRGRPWRSRRIVDIIIYHYNYHTKEKEEDQVGKEKG